VVFFTGVLMVALKSRCTDLAIARRRYWPLSAMLVLTVWHAVNGSARVGISARYPAPRRPIIFYRKIL